MVPNGLIPLLMQSVAAAVLRSNIFRAGSFQMIELITSAWLRLGKWLSQAQPECGKE